MIRKSGERVRGGIYVHIPYCIGKCTYCSFYSIGGVEKVDWSNFASSIITELDNRATELCGWTDITIYIGGGTPSLMDCDALKTMLQAIKEIVRNTCGANVKFTETTIEVNPDDVCEERALRWKEAGINRISMGVQSMIDAELKVIGRRHDAAEVAEAYRILRRHFDNISLDLIFGLPGQTMETLNYTLTKFIEMAPEHISAYSLMYEERSILAKQLEQGKVEEMAEDITVEMFQLVSSRLRGAGYERYEISNYAVPGKRSQHNSSYWEGVPYIGLGPSAHSYDGNVKRRWNIADIREYITGKGDAPYEEECLSSEELREEMIMTRLRVSDGLDLMRYQIEFGERELRHLINKSIPYIRSGCLEKVNACLALTDKGVMISDEIISSLF